VSFFNIQHLPLFSFFTFFFSLFLAQKRLRRQAKVPVAAGIPCFQGASPSRGSDGLVLQFDERVEKEALVSLVFFSFSANFNDTARREILQGRLNKTWTKLTNWQEEGTLTTS
jgi:hypothetical protein